MWWIVRRPEKKYVKIARAESDDNNNQGHQRALGSTLSKLIHQTRPVGGGDYYTSKLFMRVAAAPTSRRKEKKKHIGWLSSVGGEKSRFPYLIIIRVAWEKQKC
jgi:hypothetical protein